MNQAGIIMTPDQARRVENAVRLIEQKARAIQPTYRRHRRYIPTGGSDIHLAYCKTAAETGSTIVCYLDEDLETPPQDPVPTEITVYCKLYEGGTNLNACAPLLTDGDEMKVVKIGEYWRSLTTFIPTDTCE